MPKVVIIYGPPGSGKGTQANKIAEKLGLVHFNTGHVIEKKVFDPKLQDDPIIQRERDLFEKGILCTPKWVAEIVNEATEELHKKGKGIVFSGSPRTLPEVKELIVILENLYGKENIYVIKINVKPETSIFRNTRRRVCKKCSHSLVYSSENEKLEKCPKCGGKLVKRVLDKPKTIKVRLNQFNERTEPIYKFLTDRGYKIIDIDGEPSVEKVSEDILEKLK